MGRGTKAKQTPSSTVGKRKIAVHQILLILTYSCEQQHRLAAELQRWVVGAYRGINAMKVEELTGIADLQRLMQNKRIRWAATIYGRHMLELRGKAEQILREFLEEDMVLTWRSRGDYGRREVQIEELDVDSVDEWTDGSRIGGQSSRRNDRGEDVPRDVGYDSGCGDGRGSTGMGEM